MPKRRRDRKTKMEILVNIQEFLNESDGKPFYKSDLREKGIDPRTAEEFFRIIDFCQRELPRIRITDLGGNFIIQEVAPEDMITEFRDSLARRPPLPTKAPKKAATPSQKTKKKKRRS